MICSSCAVSPAAGADLESPACSTSRSCRCILTPCWCFMDWHFNSNFGQIAASERHSFQPFIPKLWRKLDLVPTQDKLEHGVISHPNHDVMDIMISSKVGSCGPFLSQEPKREFVMASTIHAHPKCEL